VGYKWLGRYSEAGAAGLADRSRRPLHSPGRTAEELEAAVLSVREEHPAWGGRKIARVLRDRGAATPPPSTISEILRRHGKLDGPRAGQPRDFVRFERSAPNELWQMDFKGHFATLNGRCHPLTTPDDHCRFNLILAACGDERTETVQTHLTAAFRRYGLPCAILCDNGAPWGCGGTAHGLTPLACWLIRLGVRVSHGQPYHPQTQGKDERFHRTLAADVLAGRSFAALPDCQAAFDRFREEYNGLRPHEALSLATPASRYQPSPRAFPETLPPVEYRPGDDVRRVQAGGVVHYRSRELPVPEALRGHPVAVRPAEAGPDGVVEVFFCQQRVAVADLRAEDA
jgi:transposase InsO family protein